MSLYSIEIRNIRGETLSMEAYRGNVLLIVNTATRCGFAPQFQALQRLYDAYRSQGFYVLGFPCNQFAGQEPGDLASIEQTCRVDHGVTFPMHAKIDVKGRGAHPLFRHLTREAPGLLGTRAIKWNFTKFLVDRNGRVVRRFAPSVSPDRIEPYIRELLEK